ALGLAQLAVDSIANDDVLLAGTNMDVGRTFLGGLEHQRIDPSNDRRLVIGVEHVDQLFGLIVGLLVVAGLLGPFFELGTAAYPRVGLVDVIDDLAARS